MNARTVMGVGAAAMAIVCAGGCETTPPSRAPEVSRERLARAQREVKRLTSENELLLAQRKAALGGETPAGKPTIESLAGDLRQGGYECRIDKQEDGEILLAGVPGQPDLFVTVEKDGHLRMMIVLPGKIASRPRALVAVNEANAEMPWVKFLVQDEFQAIAAEHMLSTAAGLRASQVRQAAETIGDAVREAYEQYFKAVLEPADEGAPTTTSAPAK